MPFSQQALQNMSASLKSLYGKGQAFLSPSASDVNLPNGFATAPKGGLFPVVDPAVDGPDCDHDCESCTIRFPAKFSINETDELYGHINGWSTHVLVATGKNDWVRDVADEKGSVMEALDRGTVKPRNGRLMLSASNMPPPPEYHAAEQGQQPTTVLILPSFTLVDNVTPGDIPELTRRFLDTGPTTTTLISAPMTPASSPLVDVEDSSPTEETSSAMTQEDPQMTTSHNLVSRPCPHRYLILLCSQKTRDARCGQTAPLLRRELERHLRPLGLFRDLSDERPGGVGIYFISHVGGHKYSANMMVYRKNEKGEAAQAIWLARVRPEDCEGIVRFTVLQGKVVKPERQLRGGFDREKGLVSW